MEKPAQLLDKATVAIPVATCFFMLLVVTQYACTLVYGSHTIPSESPDPYVCTCSETHQCRDNHSRQTASADSLLCQALQVKPPTSTGYAAGGTNVYASRLHIAFLPLPWCNAYAYIQHVSFFRNLKCWGGSESALGCSSFPFTQDFT